MTDSGLMSGVFKTFLVNFPETEKMNDSNDWITKTFWKSDGFQFLTFNKIEGGPNLLVVSAQSINSNF